MFKDQYLGIVKYLIDRQDYFQPEQLSILTYCILKERLIFLYNIKLFLSII